MGKVRDAAKERYWRRLLGQQGKSGETISDFCARKSVPAHQFHWWRRTLRDRQSAADRCTPPDDASKGEQDAKAFVPVRVAFPVSVPIEVVHPGGWVLRVPVGFDPLSLRRILATLDPSSDTAED